MYEYAARLVDVIDGDTIDVMVDLGFEVYTGKRLRFKGVDTEEIRDKDPIRRENAQKARDFVKSVLGNNRPLTIKTFKTRTGKDRKTFGRYVSEVYYVNDDGIHVEIGKVLIENGFQKK